MATLKNDGIAIEKVQALGSVGTYLKHAFLRWRKYMLQKFYNLV